MFRTFIWCVCNSNNNQPLSKYVTLQAKLGHDRRYHTPSESDDQTIVTHHTRSIVTHYALAL